jgi:hypothetical protein
MSNIIQGPWTIKERARAFGQHLDYVLHMLKNDELTRLLYDHYAQKMKSVIEAPGLAVGGFVCAFYRRGRKLLHGYFFALGPAPTSTGSSLGLAGIIVGVAHILIFQWRQENKSPIPVERYGGKLHTEALLAAAQRPRRADRHPAVLDLSPCNVLRLRPLTPGGHCTLRIAHTQSLFLPPLKCG